MRERRRAREEALKILYKMDLLDRWERKALEEEISYGNISDFEKIKDYLLFLIETILENRSLIDEKIKKRVKNWKFERLGILERNILRIAIAELLFSPDVPPKVAIDEAIEIAKKYVSRDAGKFVNGVLDGVLKEG